MSDDRPLPGKASKGEHFPVALHEVALPFWDRKHPLPHRQSGKAVHTDAAFQTFAKGLADKELWRVVVALTVKLAGVGEIKPGNKVFGYRLVKQRALRVPRAGEFGFDPRWPTHLWMGVRWTATVVVLVFGSNFRLPGLAMVYTTTDAPQKLVRNFTAAWDKVMNLDLFCPEAGVVDYLDTRRSCSLRDLVCCFGVCSGKYVLRFDVNSAHNLRSDTPFNSVDC